MSLVVAVLALWNGAFLAAPLVSIWPPILGAAFLLDFVAAWAEAVLPLKPPRRLAVGVGLAAGAAMTAASLALYPAAAKLVPGLSDAVNDLYRLLGHPQGWLAWVALPFVVVSEEVIFRGAVQGALERRLGRWPAVPAAVLVYALAHVASGSWALVALTVPCGLSWGLLRAATRSLWAPLLCHLVWDWALLVVFPLGA